MKHYGLVVLKHEMFRPPFEKKKYLYMFIPDMPDNLEVWSERSCVFCDMQNMSLSKYHSWDTESNAQFTHTHTYTQRSTPGTVQYVWE